VSAAASATPVTRPESRSGPPRLVVGARRRPTLEPRGLRLTHRRTDNLSAAAREVMFEGFRSRKPYTAIAMELARIGEPVSARAIGRTGFLWRCEEARRRALAELNGELLVLGLWKMEELVRLVEQLDLRTGWPLRRRQDLWRVLRGFVRRPSAEGFRALEGKLLIFWLSHRVVSHPGVNHEQ